MIQQLRKPLDKASQAIIDQSVKVFINKNIFDIIWNDFFAYKSDFESEDNMPTVLVPGGNGGTTTLEDGGMTISNSASPTANDSTTLNKRRPSDSRFDFSGESRFRITISSATNAEQDITILTGVSSAHGYGFRINDGALEGLAQTAGGSRSTVTLIAAISTNTFYVLDARFYPPGPRQTGKVEFRVDEVLKGTVVGNLPTLANTYMWDIVVKTTDTNQRSISVWDIDIMQKRFR